MKVKCLGSCFATLPKLCTGHRLSLHTCGLLADGKYDMSLTHDPGALPTLSEKNVIIMRTLRTQWAFVIFYTTNPTECHRVPTECVHRVSAECPLLEISMWKVNHRLTSLENTYFNAGFPLESVWWQISTFIQWFFSEGAILLEFLLGFWLEYTTNETISNFIYLIVTEKTDIRLTLSQLISALCSLMQLISEAVSPDKTSFSPQGMVLHFE